MFLFKINKFVKIFLQCGEELLLVHQKAAKHYWMILFPKSLQIGNFRKWLKVRWTTVLSTKNFVSLKIVAFLQTVTVCIDGFGLSYNLWCLRCSFLHITKQIFIQYVRTNLHFKVKWYFKVYGLLYQNPHFCLTETIS